MFEVESEKPATDAAMKRFHMPAALKDQHERSGWFSLRPVELQSGRGVLSIAKATPANSNLTIEKVLNQVASSHINPL